MNSNERFSIGELSKATGVKVVTIRYYEHVKPSERTVVRCLPAEEP